MDALIGHSGYIGSELGRHHAFGRHFNSHNIATIRDSKFGTAVCAAAPGSMLEANRLPEQDARRIDGLIEALRGMKAERFVLISTIAVLKDFRADDEDGAIFEATTPYGVNRRRLEEFVLDRFPQPLVVRLPALFGGVLRKNFLFDLMNPVPTMLTRERLGEMRRIVANELGLVIDHIYTWDETLSLFVIDRDRLDASGARSSLEGAIGAAGLAAVQFTNPASRFQYYDIGQLWSDIQRALAARLTVVHLAPEPVAAGDIHAAVTGSTMPDTGARFHQEDMRTAHAHLWNRTDRYIANSDEVIAGIKAYIGKVTGL